MTSSRLGRFEIVRRLAVGGMAEVFLAREDLGEGIERTVVLKTLLKDKREEEEFVTMFFDEARLLARLSHPNIAQVFAAGTQGEDCYLAMEYVQGASLRDLLGAVTHTPNGALPEAEAAAIGLTLAETLAYVHEAHDDEGRPLNIVHRDLTPSNLMVSYDGAVKLIDFGIARGENRVYETSTGVLKGTCGYMAPEQLLRSTGLDHRVDVFAFGVMLYEAATGAHPFAVKNPAMLYDRIVEARYRRPREVRPDLSPGMEELIMACMHRDADARPEDMHVVASWLRGVLMGVGNLPLMSELGELVRHMFPPGHDEIDFDAEEAFGSIPTDPHARPVDPAEWVTQIDDGK